MKTSERIGLARRAYARHQWSTSFQEFAAVDRSGELAAEDLDHLAISAYLTGQDEASDSAFSRAYRLHVEEGNPNRAARSGFWLGLTLLLRGEAGAATGWLSRAERLITGVDCVEHGYLLLPSAEMHLIQGHADSAYELASRGLSIGSKYNDPDLVAIACHLQGRALIQQWRVREGLALLDEAMVAATSGELSPIVTGLVYCSVIEVCQLTFALDRSREWTSSLARWCDAQPDLVAFTATCLVCRAEVLQLSGDWPHALEEATRACQRISPPARAFYQQAEVHRLRGEHEQAEASYRRAGDCGYDPQPGLSLLRLAQGHRQAAAAMITRALNATTGRTPRARLLPAYVETMLALEQLDDARAASDELTAVADDVGTVAMRAMALQTRGSVQLAEGNARAAGESLREASQLWEQVGAPYETARARVLLGLACRVLGDDETARMELDAAGHVFQELGAVTDLEGLHSSPSRSPEIPHGLSQRELQVLKLIATGLTNKDIAGKLYISQRTVDRHVSNIFTKLRVSTRSAATAFAYEHNLV